MIKKRHLCICLLSISLFVSGCVNIYPPIPKGRWESTAPKIYIEFGALMNPSQLPEIGDRTENRGEIIHENGTTTKISLSYMHGKFDIYEYREDARYGTEDKTLYRGKYRLKGDKLRLILEDDGGELVFKRVGDVSESSE